MFKILKLENVSYVDETHLSDLIQIQELIIYKKELLYFNQKKWFEEYIDYQRKRNKIRLLKIRDISSLEE